MSLLFHEAETLAESVTTLAEEATTAAEEVTTNIFEQVTSGGFWMGIWDWAKDFVLTSGIRIIGAILVLIIGLRLMKWINKKIKNSKAVAKMPINLQSITKNFVKAGMWVLLLIILAAIVGIEMSSIVATIAALGLVVGMALEGSLSNLAGGVMLLIFKPFSVNDFINFGDEELEGIVTDVGIFYTTVKTTDARIVQIPNGTLCNKPITDYSTFETKKQKINIVVSYREDIDKVRAILLDVVKNCKRVIQEPKKPKVVCRGFKTDGIEFGIRVWVNSLDFKKAKYEIIEATARAFKANGIKFPHDQLDVHFDDVNKAAIAAKVDKDED